MDKAQPTNVSAWYQIAGDILARNIWTEVPFNWDVPAGKKIQIFARELRDATQPLNKTADFPVIVYLQGGPGGKGNRPLARDPFLEATLKNFRVLLPDQRGTGRSSPIKASNFAQLSGKEGAEQLSLYRADSIIKDFEEIRKIHYGDKKWWTFGQSYGGFLTLHYLSVAPESVTASVITGGIPSLEPNPIAVYEATFPRVLQKNKEFFGRFPHLQKTVNRIADILQNENVFLPDGDKLTVRRFQTLGMNLGTQVGFDRLHWILDEAFTDTSESDLSDTFLAETGAATSFVSNPLYMVLQESIYGPGATTWAASKVLTQFPEFKEVARPLLFTGEMAFEWMADEVKALKPFAAAWRELTQNIWPIKLYNLKQLATNKVPIEAAVFLNDMYVDSEISLTAASQVKNLNTWVTNEYEHDGLRMANVVQKLFDNLKIRLNLL